MKKDIEIALRRMGYRQHDLAKSTRWGKPLGFTILTGDVVDNELTMCQWLMLTPTKPELSVWCRAVYTFDPEEHTIADVVSRICVFEEYHLKEYGPPILQKFDFLTKLEDIELSL
jgi:hypothetical protein